MPLPHINDSLQTGVQKRELLAWAFYDFANSGYTTVVLTAVFAAYFVGSVAQGASWATLAWTSALSLSYAIVMITMPVLGAWADRHSAKKRLLGFSTVGCVVSTALLATVEPYAVGWALILIVISNVCFSWGESLIAAFLPEIAKPHAMGRVSGWGWSFGYVGGMFTLGLCLMYVIHAQSKGVSAQEFVPVTLLITALIFGVTASLSLWGLSERKALSTPGALATRSEQTDQPWHHVFVQLKQTWQQAQAYPDFVWLLWCTVAYQGGVAVAITLAAIYAEQEIGFLPQETMALIFILNIAAALGAFGLGHAQDRLGHQRALAITLVGWILTCLIAAAATSKGVFWWAAILAGLCMGSSQSIGRAMAGILSPYEHRAQYYGLWTFATRLAGIVGPLSYGLITWVAGGNQRWALLATSLLFVAGLILLRQINMTRGLSRLV